MSPNGRSLLQKMLIRQEALKTKMYKDTTGNWTIGVGHNLTVKGISEAIALAILVEDEQDAMRELAANLPWYSNMCEPRQMALISMCFNLGIEGLLKFKQTLDALEKEDWKLAHDNVLLSLAAHQDFTRYQEIAQIFLTGELA